jgi:hypothetical protein
MSWEDTFASWGKAPGQTEQTKCDNAVRAVRKAVDASGPLSRRNVSVFPQGSYANRTNVREDSDVDICVLCRDTIFFDIPIGKTLADYELHSPASYTYTEFKSDLENALTSYFGQSVVSRGKKAFNIHENTYRIDADTVACFEYHRYQENGMCPKGTAFIPDEGYRIINWPEQNYENGVLKNDETNHRFKAVVRILKHLRNYMEEKNIDSAKSIPSFLIENLVWNAPNAAFGHDTYRDDVWDVLACVFNGTLTLDGCTEWTEINQLKYLFRPGQPWTFDRTHEFASAAWRFLGFS